MIKKKLHTHALKYKKIKVIVAKIRFGVRVCVWLLEGKISPKNVVYFTNIKIVEIIKCFKEIIIINLC